MDSGQVFGSVRGSASSPDTSPVGLVVKSAPSLRPALYDELRQFRLACGDAHMKTILAVGDLDSLTTVYKASLVAMMAGGSHDPPFSGRFRRGTGALRRFCHNLT